MAVPPVNMAETAVPHLVAALPLDEREKRLVLSGHAMACPYLKRRSSIAATI
jgi:hypothetical protein